MSTRGQGAWLFGAIPDLMLGGGLLYLLIASGLVALGPAARDLVSPGWVAYLILIVSGSHYGGTLLRVYEHRSERRIYRLFTIYGTFLMLAVLIGALYSPLAGSLLITLYLTWSPWHYTGQNYGIALMFLGRRGVDVTPTTKRLFHASFVSSYLLVLLTMHFEGSAGQADPLGYASLDTEKFQFVSAGLPNSLRSILLPPVIGVYLASVIAALYQLLRAGTLRSIAPALLVMLTQAIWFSIPYIASYLGIAAGIPALNAIEPRSYQFYFAWVALGHAAQYLWITTYYARADRRWRGHVPYFVKVFVFGNAVWAAPVVLFGPTALGRPDYDFGLAMCVAAAVNLHHFMLDGAIWKLRNPKLASVLLRAQPETPGDVEPIEPPRSKWLTPLAWTLAGLFCVTRILPYVELDHRFPAALARQDYATAESILDRAAYYGRDSSTLRLQLAHRLTRSREPSRSIRHRWRSLDLNPTATGYAELGRLSRTLLGVESAEYAWRTGLARFPEDFALNLRLGASLLLRRETAEAIPYLERAASIRPDDEEAKQFLAEARKG